MTATQRTTPIEILLVEDSESDVVLTQALLKDAKVVNHLSVARDGEEALRRVRLEGEHRDAPRPDLILLDLNLPRKDGREVLRELPRQLDGFEVPDERLNPNGGAVAIGHPFGSSGTRYVLTLATELRLREARYGVLGVCVGSGQGVALILENPKVA